MLIQIWFKSKCFRASRTHMIHLSVMDSCNMIFKRMLMSKWLVAEWTGMIFLHLMNCFDVNIERLFVLKCGMTLWASMTVRLFKLHGWEISFWIKCSQRGCSTFHERLFFANSSTLERKKLQCPPCLSTEVPFSAFSLFQLDFTTYGSQINGNLEAVLTHWCEILFNTDNWSKLSHITSTFTGNLHEQRL